MSIRIPWQATSCTFFPEILTQTLGLVVGNRSLHFQLYHIIYMKANHVWRLKFWAAESCDKSNVSDINRHVTWEVGSRMENGIWWICYRSPESWLLRKNWALELLDQMSALCVPPYPPAGAALLCIETCSSIHWSSQSLHKILIIMMTIVIKNRNRSLNNTELTLKNTCWLMH